MEEVKKGIEVVGEVMKLAGDHPKVKQAGNELAQTALTITKTINNALLPLAAVNFAFEKARRYFEENFKDDIEERTKNIPPQHIVEPKASIAGPALQGLAFSHEEKELRELYIALLASSMDGRVQASVHPAFVDIIKQLASEEARLLPTFLKSKSGMPIVELRLQAQDGQSYTSILKHCLQFERVATRQPVENENLPAIIDNLIRLGLIEVDYISELKEDKHYSWVEGRPEFIRFKKELEVDGQKLVFKKGVLQRTALAAKLAMAIEVV
jgi:hypothetical protein